MIIDIIGWMGATAVLGAYAMVSSGRAEAGSWRYQGLNLAGAAGLMLNTAYYAAYPSTALNVVWALIAAAAMWRLFAARRRVAS